MSVIQKSAEKYDQDSKSKFMEPPLIFERGEHAENQKICTLIQICGTSKPTAFKRPVSCNLRAVTGLVFMDNLKKD